jgi:RNA polymerase sigma factor (sigma-70 family)
MNGQTTLHQLRGDGGRQFSDTHWSVVLKAKDEGSRQAAEAMERLCRTYWHPLYAYIRREGHGPEAAEDLTQEFFARLLAKDYLQHLRHREGKFRSFLLTLVKRFLSDERDKARAQKRGGGQTLIALDETRAEELYLGRESRGLNPDQLFDRRWAETVMECALGRLRKEYADGGKSALFDQLKDIQPGEHGESSYAEIGARLGLAEGSVKSAVHRLRRRHREILREEIARTVARTVEIDEEIRDLLGILSQ